jgi:hypothetical protein
MLTAILVGASATFAGAFAAPSNAPASTAAGKSNAPVATNAAPVEAPIPLSVFTMPTPKGGGKDPFYPETTRFQQRSPAPSPTNKVVVAEFKINGFSGNASDPLVIINSNTFGKGDEQMVQTPGGRVKVRCVEINVPERLAVIEVNGDRRELRFPANK